MARCVIFVEGSRKTDNGDLRSGFTQLLRQATLRHQLMVVMSDDTHEAIRKFRAETAKPNSVYQHVLLLVDLDGPGSGRAAWLAAEKLTRHADQIFFMVQAMEAWFLSQPGVLHAYYGTRLPHALPTTSPELIRQPDQLLARCTAGTRKGTYHKTGHGAQLLPRLVLADLRAAFPDVDRLLRAL